MEPLFSAAGIEALAVVLRSRPLLAFDFDGTIAPLVPRPDDAHVPPELAARLDRLALLGPLAIVTGRSPADVAPRLGFRPGFIIGNHGAEETGIPSRVDPVIFDALRGRIGAHAAALQAAGIGVDDKRYSLTLHYRQSPDPALALRQIDALLEELPVGLQVIPGKMVANIVAADAPDKGDAVASLLLRTGCTTAVYVGDDSNDEPAFARAPHRWFTIRVGEGGAGSSARYFIDGFEDTGRMLDLILDLRLDRP